MIKKMKRVVSMLVAASMVLTSPVGSSMTMCAEAAGVSDVVVSEEDKSMQEVNLELTSEDSTSTEGTSEETEESEKTTQEVSTENTSEILIMDGVWYTEDEEGITIVGYADKEEEIDLGEIFAGKTVVAIGELAFHSCSVLKRIVIPKTCKTIETDAFSLNRSLETVIFEEGSILESIGEQAFLSCLELKNIELPDTCKVINESAFCRCEGLVQFQLPDACIEIGSAAFQDCSFLSEVTVGEKSVLEKIGDNAFEYCVNMTSFSMPETCVSIGNYAFSECNKISSMELPKSCTSIGDGAFQNIGITSITLPSGLTQISSSMFYMCEKLTEITIPESVKTIGEKAFYEVPLKSVKIPKNVEEIGENAFSDKIKIVFFGDPTLADGIFGSGTVIYGQQDSKMQAYAEKNNIPFYYNATKLELAGKTNDMYIYYGSTLNDENMQKIGTEIKATLLDGTEKVISLNDCEVIGDLSEVGEKEITVVYGLVSVSFTINVYYELSSDKISICSIGNQTYNSREITPKPDFVYNRDIYEDLYENEDYSLAYENNVNAGTATVIVNGIGNYKGSIQTTFTINRKCISDDDVVIKVKNMNQIYTGEETKPELSIRLVDENGSVIEELAEGEDYSFNYNYYNNNNKIVVKVEGLNNYKESTTKEFLIEGVATTEATTAGVPEGSTTEATTAGVPEGSTTETTTAGVPGGSTAEVTIGGVSGGSTIDATTAGVPGGSTTEATTAGVPGGSTTEATTGGESEGPTTEATTAGVPGGSTTEATIGGVSGGSTAEVTTGGESEGSTTEATTAGVPEGSTTATPSVQQPSTQVPVTSQQPNEDSNTKRMKITSKCVSLKKVVTYSKKLKIKLKVIVNGKKLKKGKDYTVTYKNNKKPGLARVTVKGIGQYSGKVTKKFIIVPGKVKLSYAKSKKSKKLTVKWRKAPGVSGYKITIATDKKLKKCKKNKIVKSRRKSSCNFKKLKKKKYYVRVRAYVKIKGKKYYGAYSSAKKVSIKK